MQRVMFFNYNPIGLGGLWQNISFLLSNQKTDLEINLHLDDRNTERFMEMFQCFAKPKHNVYFKFHKETTYVDNRNQSWHQTINQIRNHIVDTTDYKLYQIQTVDCTMWHDYYPTRFKRKTGNHICIYLQNQSRNDDSKLADRDLTNEQTQHVKDLLKGQEVVELGPHMTIEENCKLISESKLCLGREGGWAHVAHSCAIDYYPVMNNEHQFLRWCHGGHNKYLKAFTHVKNFKSLCKEIL